MTSSSDPIISQNPFFQRENWKSIRMELVPAFTTNRVKTFYPIITSVCQKLCSYVEETGKTSQEMDIDDVSWLRIKARVNKTYLFRYCSSLEDLQQMLHRT